MVEIRRCQVTEGFLFASITLGSPSDKLGLEWYNGVGNVRLARQVYKQGGEC